MTFVQSFFGKDWKNVLSFDKVIDDGISMDDGGEDGVLVGDGKIQAAVSRKRANLRTLSGRSGRGALIKRC